MSDLIASNIGAWSTEAKTGDLRWSRAGVLEERWVITTMGTSRRQYYAGDEVLDRKVEWRPIPVEE